MSRATPGPRRRYGTVTLHLEDPKCDVWGNAFIDGTPVETLRGPLEVIDVTEHPGPRWPDCVVFHVTYNTKDFKP